MALGVKGNGVHIFYAHNQDTYIVIYPEERTEEGMRVIPIRVMTEVAASQANLFILTNVIDAHSVMPELVSSHPSPSTLFESTTWVAL
jgi:hypothetical protein